MAHAANLHTSVHPHKNTRSKHFTLTLCNAKYVMYAGWRALDALYFCIVTMTTVHCLVSALVCAVATAHAVVDLTSSCAHIPGRTRGLGACFSRWDNFQFRVRKILPLWRAAVGTWHAMCSKTRLACFLLFTSFSIVGLGLVALDIAGAQSSLQSITSWVHTCFIRVEHVFIPSAS